jgi:hypothetical protein
VDLNSAVHRAKDSPETIALNRSQTLFYARVVSESQVVLLQLHEKHRCLIELGDARALALQHQELLQIQDQLQET